MLDVGATEEISIALVDTECRCVALIILNIFDHISATCSHISVCCFPTCAWLFCSRVVSKFHTTGQTEKLDKHRFLVMTKEMDDEDFDRISLCSASQRQDEFTKLWASGPAPAKDDKRNLKMHVHYTYPRPDDEQRKSHKDSPRKEKSTGGGHATPEPYKDTSKGTPGSPGSAAGSSDLEALKAKYDAIVEYTVHLTAERDMIVTQLEVMKKEYNNELKQGKKSDKKGGEASAGDKSKDAEMKVVQVSTAHLPCALLLFRMHCFALVCSVWQVAPYHVGLIFV
jgi:hypothetical protein